MRLLRNPTIVAVLAVVAVVTVFYQVLKPWWQRHATRQGAPPPVFGLSTPPSGVNAPAAGAASTPPLEAGSSSVSKDAIAAASEGAIGASGLAMDRAAIMSRLPLWVESPRRDPFRLSAPEIQDSSPAEGYSPVRDWKLRGIWRQTGESVAAINNGVYKEGDRIGRYRIERIEAGSVWLEGDNRSEQLSFVVTSKTNTPSGGEPGAERKQ